MTLLQFQNALRARLGEPSPGYWSDALLTIFVNNAIRYVERRTRCLRSNPRKGNMVATFALYIINETFGGPNQILKVDYLGEDATVYLPLTYTTMHYLEFSALDYNLLSTGTPKYWYICEEEKAIGLCPIPDYSKTDGIIVYPWRFDVDLAAAGDEPLLSTKYDDVIIELCLAEAAAKRGDKEMIIYRTRKAEVMLLDMEKDFLAPGPDEQPAMPDPKGLLLI